MLVASSNTIAKIDFGSKSVSVSLAVFFTEVFTNAHRHLHCVPLSFAGSYINYVPQFLLTIAGTVGLLCCCLLELTIRLYATSRAAGG